MALIWAEGFTGDKALALLWQRHKAALTLAGAKAAKDAYERTVVEAEAALRDRAEHEESRTHALVVGVGRYTDPNIKALTTSVRGAWAFADWMLTRFHHPNRPLGSVELILSPGDLGDWQPSPEAAEKLGLTGGSTPTPLPVEEATFTNIKIAFERWLDRAGTHLNNAAFFYFSGHGLWKQDPYLLPEDAQIASSTKSFDNLIDIHQTGTNMFNRRPSIQCFFVDACQEVTQEILENLSMQSLGESLCRPTNAAVLKERELCRYYGSKPAQRAFGPADAPPFFTQELLACLERRGADSVKVGGTWRVIPSSLQRALQAASEWRKEEDEKAKGIQFPTFSGVSTMQKPVTLCQIQGSPEVIVQVECSPADTMPHAKLFIRPAGGERKPRLKPLPNPWFTKVAHGGYLAGAEFEASAAFESAPESFETIPPVHPVELTVKQRP
jgi:hypothetical protein